MKRYFIRWAPAMGVLLMLVFFRCKDKDMPIARLPKVELHLHLDCSLSYNVVKQLDPAVSYDTYRREFLAPARCSDLADYIARATRAVNLMQTREALRLVTLDVMRQLQADHVVYAELRFAPLQHLQKGLTPEEVVRTVNDALDEGIRETGVEASLLLCTLRHYDEQQSMTTVKLVEQFKGTHVAGFDIAADEAAHGIAPHINAFEYAHAHGIPCTAHAGEAKGPESVRETLSHFHPARIGHGVRSIESASLLQQLKAADIHLEVCPTSNIQTAIYNAIADHPVDKLYASGVSMSINTDCRTISGITLSGEYQQLVDVFGWDKARFLRCNLEALRHAFISENKRAVLRERLMEGY